MDERSTQMVELLTYLSKNARKKKGLEGEVEDELIGQAEALYDGLGNSEKLSL